jgi:hypothetical protein
LAREPRRDWRISRVAITLPALLYRKAQRALNTSPAAHAAGLH